MEILYLSSRGRWYILSCSICDGVEPSARWITDREAAAWLMVRDIALPRELVGLAAEVAE